VSALARALSVDEDAFQSLAGLERSPAPIRRQMERLDQERGRAVRTRDRMIAGALFQVASRPGVLDPIGEALDLSTEERALFGRLVRRVRHVRTAEEAQEKADDLLQEVPAKDRDAIATALPRVLAAAPAPGAPAPAPAARAADARLVELPVRASLLPGAPAAGTFAVDSSVWRPRAFLLRVSTDDAWPRIEPGDLLLVDPDAAPHPGDWVAFRHEERDLARAYQRHGEEVRLVTPRPDVPPIRRPLPTFRPEGVVLWLGRSLA
jgi:SOS-response transcriptional repressor LexA